ncbi:MAG: LamG domain-containing protein, partial [Sedimentisphaerales bacterium]
MCKKLIYLVSFVLVLSMTGNASAALLVHWRFDEGSGTTAYDSSGNGHDGTFVGDPKWVAGKIGGALEFGGDGDSVVDDDAENYLNGLDAVTICIWIKSDVAPTDKGFIDCEQPDGSDNIITMRYDAAGATGGGTSLLKMAVVAPNDEQQLESSSNLQVTEWQHVAMVWSRNEQLKFYVNGVLDTPQANGTPRDVSTSDVTMLIVGQGGKDAGAGWDGLIDDVRIYDEALTEPEILAAMKGEAYPYALGPVPQDGAIYLDTWVNLSWAPGDFALSHDVYFGDNFEDVDAGAESTFRGNQTSMFLIVGFPGFPFPDGLVPGTTYYWRIDEINELDPNSPWKGNVWSFMIAPRTAYDPDPADGAELVALDAKLSWTAGFGAKLHTVYFGDNFDNVSSAAGGLPQGTATYNPGPLKSGKTYYWRVDEFDIIATYKG